MRKRLKRLLNKKGLTLVEILVVLVVTSILLACAMGMLTPVNNLLNSMKSNAHMDTMCDTANEYIRGALEKAEAVSILIYPDETADAATKNAAEQAMINKWNDYSAKYKASEGYQLRAVGVLGNYNGDFRLFDFGDVTKIDCKWGVTIDYEYDGSTPSTPMSLNSDSTHGQAFQLMVAHRDGGGRWRGGLNGNEFHWYDAFNDEFYSNGASGNYNYSYQMVFESVGETLEDGSTGVNYLKISSQIFKRKGNVYSADPDEQVLTFTPANQMKTLSFKLLNGSAELSSAAGGINTVANIDGVDQIDISSGMNGVVILYAVRDIDAYYTMTTTATPSP